MKAALTQHCRLAPLTLSEIDAVMAIEVRCYSHPWTRGNFSDSLAAGYLALTLKDEAGELMAYLVAMPGADEMHLLNITVAPRHQRQGLARQMLQVLFNEAANRAMPRLWLEVRAGNATARALYAKQGFHEVALRRAYYPSTRGLREDAVVMCREQPQEPGNAPASCHVDSANSEIPHGLV